VSTTQVRPSEESSGEFIPTLSRRDRLAIQRRNAKRSRWEWVIVLGAAVLIAVLLRTFVVQTFYIPSESMVPTLQKNDRVVVNKLSYKLHEIKRHDIVVFTTPPMVNPEFKDLVKRVIGLPGDKVQGKKGRLYVNGKVQDEDYLPAGDDGTTDAFGPITVPPDTVWVMGDNRRNSEDSRVFGPIPQNTIVGRVFVRIWPPSRVDLL
jgi:signal peptidase I